MSRSKLEELEQIQGRIKYANDRKNYLVEYLEDLAKGGELTAHEIIERAKELVGLEEQLKAEDVKLDTLSLIIGYEDTINKLEGELKEATIDSFQNLQR
jgi:predicted  nucleic acid-binding Zn-ribbon protein